MKKLVRFLGLLVLVSAAVSSCKKKEEFPVVPEIKFEEFLKLYDPSLGIYNRGILKVSFTDGDGDIGLGPDDTVPPYKYNLFIHYYEIQNGDTVRVIITDSTDFYARIPMLTPSGTNKSIKGEIEDTLFMYNFNSQFDTIMFDASILDRQLHKSNVITTPLINRK